MIFDPSVTFVIPAQAGNHFDVSSLRGLCLSLELGGFTPLRGASHFLLLVQNKVTKEKHAPRLRRLRRYPPVLVEAGRP
jgi:hypothetical protein